MRNTTCANWVLNVWGVGLLGPCTATYSGLLCLNWVLVWDFRRVFMLFWKPQSKRGNHTASESDSTCIWVSSEPCKQLGASALRHSKVNQVSPSVNRLFDTLTLRIPYKCSIHRDPTDLVTLQVTECTVSVVYKTLTEFLFRNIWQLISVT
jgi:hypothetical protein